MNMFSSCSGECCTCAIEDNCVAGHGDDEYCPADVDTIIERLLNNRYPSYRKTMLDYIGMTEEDFQAYIMPNGKKDRPEPKEETRKFPDGLEPFTEVPVTMFNPKFWIIADLYVIEVISTGVRDVYFLSEIFQMGNSIGLASLHDAIELTVAEFMSEFKVIKHITKDSILED